MFATIELSTVQKPRSCLASLASIPDQNLVFGTRDYTPLSTNRDWTQTSTNPASLSRSIVEEPGQLQALGTARN